MAVPRRDYVIGVVIVAIVFIVLWNFGFERIVNWPYLTVNRMIYPEVNVPIVGQFWIGKSYCGKLGNLTLSLGKDTYALGEPISGIAHFTYDDKPIKPKINIRLLLKNETTDTFMVFTRNTTAQNVSGTFTMNLTQMFLDEILPLGEWRVHINLETDDCTWIYGNRFSIVPEKPDLILRSVSTNSTSVVVGDTLSITIGIENAGGSDSGELFVRIYDDQAVFRDILVKNLIANETTVIKFDWRPSTPGIHTIRVFADYYGFVHEKDEWNNMRTTVVYVT